MDTFDIAKKGKAGYMAYLSNPQRQLETMQTHSMLMELTKQCGTLAYQAINDNKNEFTKLWIQHTKTNIQIYGYHVYNIYNPDSNPGLYSDFKHCDRLILTADKLRLRIDQNNRYLIYHSNKYESDVLDAIEKMLSLLNLFSLEDTGYTMSWSHH